MNKIKKSKGWFYKLRGNGYGPFTSEKEAWQKKCEKARQHRYSLGWDSPKPFYAEIEVYNKQLVSIKFNKEGSAIR